MAIELKAAEALQHVALDETVKAYVLQNPPLCDAVRRAAMRFIGGETLPQCVEVAKSLNQQGHAVTIDFMGESTHNIETAEHPPNLYQAVVDIVG